MKTRFSSLQGRVVVVTGASSGIGRATALAFARQGANVVVAARRERPLARVAKECEKLGVSALAIPTDVTNPTAMEQLAAQALETFGEIHVWVNNAGVGLFGPFVGAEIPAHRRVIATNLLGPIHGAAAVLPHFLQTGRGVLISTVSIGGYAPVPFAAAYTASKFGLRGFLASLRQELAHLPEVHVCGVFPAIVDTPGFQHGANVSGAELRPGGPLLSPERVAEAIVETALHPRPEVTVGWPTPLARAAYGAFPVLTERMAGMTMRRFLKSGAPARRTLGNLFQPVSAGTQASGGWKTHSDGESSSLPWLGLAGLVAGAATLFWGINRHREQAADLAGAGI